MASSGELDEDAGWPSCRRRPARSARPSSTRNGIRASVPSGQTVSKWPSTRAGAALGSVPGSGPGHGRRPRSFGTTSTDAAELCAAVSAIRSRQAHRARACRGWATRARPAPRARRASTRDAIGRWLQNRHRTVHRVRRGSASRREGQRRGASGASIRSTTGSTPSPGRVEHRDGPVVRQDRRLDDVLAIILVRAGDVAGQREAGQAARSRRWPPGRCRTRASRRTRPGRPRAWQTSWTRFASSRPPTRLTLMLITRQAPRSSALRASSAEWMLSSRQIGVSSAAWSRAWSMMSSWASGCSIRSRSKSSSCLQRRRGRRACRPSWRRPGAACRDSARGPGGRPRRPSPGAIFSLIRR